MLQDDPYLDVLRDDPRTNKREHHFRSRYQSFVHLLLHGVRNSRPTAYKRP